MLLEYFKKESFSKLYSLQVAQDGIPEEMEILEGGIISKTSEQQQENMNTEYPIGADLELWQKDPWLNTWLKSEPKLAGIDLRPYYYFSRDQLSAAIVVSRRMTPTAQSILSKILHSSEAFQRQAISESGQLSNGDAAAIFDTVIQKIKQEGDQVNREALLKTLFSWVESRRELLSQLLEFLDNTAPENITTTAVPQLLKVVKGSAYEPNGYNILKKWSDNTANSSLAKIAKSRFTKRK
jgi:hypothetical protein